MALNKKIHYKLADKEDAEIFWECLRRRADYLAYYTERKQLNKILSAARQLPNDIVVKNHINDILANFRATRNAIKNWGVRFVINPQKKFSSLTQREIKLICTLDSGVEDIKLKCGELSKDLMLALFYTVNAKGYLLPYDFMLTITPAKKRYFNEKGREIPLRDSTDIHWFRLSMRAWDMRKDGKNWHTIGRLLDLKLFKTGKTKSPDDGKQARETAARNYWKSANTKINRCLDLRAVIKEPA